MSQSDTPLRTARLKKLRRMRRARRARKISIWSVLGLSGLGILAGLAVLLLLDQTMRAPDWVRDRVEAELEAGLSGLQIEFGDVELVISEGWRPRAALRDVRVSDADGRPILSLSDAEASLAMRPLLRGEVQPKQIALRGAFAVLRRNADGAVSLAFDGAANPVEQAPGLVPLIEQLDAIFARPELAALTEVALTQVNLRYEDAVSGQAWTVDGGRFVLGHSQNELRISGSLALLTGRDFASSIEVNYTSDIGSPAAEFGLVLSDVPARDIASQSVALSWLRPLRAPLSGALRGAVNETGDIGPLNATLQIGTGVLQPTDEARPIPFENAQAYFTFDPAERVLRFDEIAVRSDWVTGSVEGAMWLGVAERGRVTDLTGQMRLTRTRLNPGGLYPEPVELEGAAADFRLALDPFTLTLGQVFVEDQGNQLHLSGDLRADSTGWTVAIDAVMDALTPERLATLWPEAAVANARDWVTRNLSGGQLQDINVALRLRPGQKPDVYLDFDYADTQITFMPTMPPIEGASGQASLVDNRFVTTAIAGTVTPDEGGPINVAGTSFIMPDTSIRTAAPGIVRVQGRGTITSVLSLLNRAPLSILEKPGLPVTMAEGQTEFQGNISLPLKDKVPLEEVAFFIDALARNVASDVLIPGQILQAPDLRITASAQAVEVAGQGLISAIPFTARWVQPLGRPGAGSRVEGTVTLSAQMLERFNIALPPGSVAGSGPGQVQIDLPVDGAPRLALQSDLTGLRLAIPELGWLKPPDERGSLDLTATLGTPAQIDGFTLQAPGLSAAGTVRAAVGGGLDVAEFSSVRRADWLDVRARLEGQGAGQPPRVRIDGGTFDLRRAEFGTSENRDTAAGGNDALIASLDRLQVTDTIALTGFSGQFGLRGGLSGNFEGALNGGTPVTGRIAPEDGRSAVQVQSQDAGGVFRDAGLLRQAYGGVFNMVLRPVGEPGNFDGSLTVANTNVRNAPAMAALLNAISIVGLLTELSGQGILFNEVVARFRLSPSQVTLYESRATGPSLGLSMDGVYDVPNQRLNMQGVISPVYLLNQIGAVFSPRRGEGLFGFNYTLTGPSQDPRVQVNPLSALTPGVLRDIFRQPAPEAPDAAEPGATAPDPTENSLAGDR